MLTPLISLALAVPIQMTQQGHVLDSSGSALQGLHDLTFSIYDDATAGLGKTLH